MTLIPAQWVTSGFFRVHLWVLMGLQTFAALALWSLRAGSPAGEGVVFWQVVAAVIAAVVSYLGAVIWMYEARSAGKAALIIVAAAAFFICLAPSAMSPGATTSVTAAPIVSPGIKTVEVLSGGLLVGLITTAMLLGHWYLNTPTMKLEPLQRLLVYLAIAILVRMVISVIGTSCEAARLLQTSGGLQTSWLVFISLRWFAGLLLPLLLTYLTWQTLKIPNTQSATGILYAGVILVFIGELAAQMLSAATSFPL
ncbi:hypothetical protein ETAA8_56610 [Anatilimnocola aggregata]|uniref:Uncharacterized protein n=1 Tax=Anatilimnocola aggregata TaxID=2528021 RepID=A0A517YJX3_9BACT|nr:hypothetical protein [Anatilimnocola aggregata]QDU30516.1 hypothetical protein ETAA8_56610 [Anatilimnocola aggregata]